MVRSEQKPRHSRKRRAVPGRRVAADELALDVCVLLLSMAALGCSSETLLTLGRMPVPDAARDVGEASTDVPSETFAEVSDASLVTFDGSSPDSSPGTSPEASSSQQTVYQEAGVSGSASSGEDTGRYSGEDAGSPVFTFDTPVLVEELFSGAKDDNPTLTWDMKEIYFSSKREEGNTNLWWAHRENVDEPFSTPEFLADLSSSGFDTSPAVDGDGLTFWFASVREDAGSGGLDILRVQRATRDEGWGTPELVPELNSDSDDIPRPTGAGGLIMPLASRRGGADYLTYFAKRERADQAFTSTELAENLAAENILVADAFLTIDGLAILYTQAAEGQAGDLYYATRPNLEVPFSGVRPIASLNTEADERDPWLSPDGETLYFSSDRDGTLAIYRATRL